jgi:hypothetical protein
LMWMINTGLGEALPMLHCVSDGHALTASTIVTVVLAGAGAVIALLAARQVVGMDRFLLIAAGFVSWIFLFALMLQAAAAIMIDPCAR